MRYHLILAALCLGASGSPLEPPPLEVQEAADGDIDTTERQEQASIEQVEQDLKRMDSFNAEVRRSLDESDKAKRDILHTLGYVRRKHELEHGERENARVRFERVEDEVFCKAPAAALAHFWLRP